MKACFKIAEPNAYLCAKIVKYEIRRLLKSSYFWRVSLAFLYPLMFLSVFSANSTDGTSFIIIRRCPWFSSSLHRW